MATQNYFILTSAQRTAAMAFNDPSASIDPRAIDSATPGSGINLNENADGFAAGAAVTLTDKFVAPVRIMNDPAYLSEVPDMIAYLLDLPWCLLEDETIFLPSQA
jgi:hypothetical protein